MPSTSTAMVDDKAKRSPRVSEAHLQKYGTDLPAWWHDDISDEAIARIELVQARKIVTLFCEFGSDCITDFEGQELFVEQLPITALLMARIRKWCRLPDKLQQEQELADGPVNWKPFVDEGYHISVALKRELPDWTVSYADEFKTYLTPGGYFCPEILADGTLGPCTVEKWKGKVATESRNTFIG